MILLVTNHLTILRVVRVRGKTRALFVFCSICSIIMRKEATQRIASLVNKKSY